MASTQLTAAPKNITLVPADDLASKVELIRRTVAVGATNDELELFLHQCRKTGLDPLARQIYCIKRGDKATIQTGIDGYRLIADRTGLYAGNDDAVFEGNDDGHPLQARVTVWKLVGGQRCPFSATARWAEYFPGERGGQMWRKMPYVLLAKCAEALALRKAFPADLSGIYTDAEMHQADAPAPEPDSEAVRRARILGWADKAVKELARREIDIASLGSVDDNSTLAQIEEYGKRLKEALG
jgi:phage recombination protein Bet